MRRRKGEIGFVNWLRHVACLGFMVLAFGLAYLDVAAQTHQTDSSSSNAVAVSARLRRLEADIRRVERLAEETRGAQRSETERIDRRIDGLSNTAQGKIDELNGKVEGQGQTVQEGLRGLDGRIEEKAKTTYSYLASAVGGLSLILVVGFLFLRRKHSHTREHVEATRKSLEDRWVQTDTKLVELLEREVKISGEVLAEASASGPGPSGERDHSLQLKVADEIVRIQNYLSFLDPAAKGVKHLAAAVTRLEDNLAAEGYEIPKLLNRPYDPGMKVIAYFKPNENLAEGEEIITRIIKPAVNYNGVMIQAAEIEVSQG